MKKKLAILLVLTFIAAVGQAVAEPPSGKAWVVYIPDVPAGEWFGSTVMARDKAIGGANENTAVNRAAPCPFTGQIKAVRVYATGPVDGIEFACFKHNGGNIFATDAPGKATQSSGSAMLDYGLNTLLAGEDFAPFDCNAGEYPGFYAPHDTGGVAADHDGGAGISFVSQREIPPHGVLMAPVNTGAVSLRFYVE